MVRVFQPLTIIVRSYLMGNLMCFDLRRFSQVQRLYTSS